jgi:hypothetical protein
MTRYKGHTKSSLIDRKFPHRVEMVVPEGLSPLFLGLAWSLAVE